MTAVSDNTSPTRGAPLEIKRLSSTTANGGKRGSGLEISWANGQRFFYASELLRKSCPCATCREARGEELHEKPLTAGRATLKVLKATSDEQTDLRRVWAVGNYALGIEWADRHNSGIYTFEFLAQLPGVEQQ